jgi:alanine dehydrogenase
MDQVELRNRLGEIYALFIKKPEQPWIYVQWIGDIDVEMLKEGVLYITEIIKEFNCQAVLSDRRTAQGNWFAINNWMEHKWAPIATKAGLQYMAHVRAPQAISQLSSQDMESRLLGFTFKSFDSIEQAEDWLLEMLA